MGGVFQGLTLRLLKYIQYHHLHLMDSFHLSKDSSKYFMQWIFGELANVGTKHRKQQRFWGIKESEESRQAGHLGG
jgi:hypothetical protein